MDTPPPRPDPGPPHAPVVLRPDARRRVRDLLFAMVYLEVLVVVLDLWLNLCAVLPSDDLRAFFDATSEQGLGSWLAVTQTSLIALTLWGMAAAYRPAPRWRRAGWAVLAAFFSYLALDDGTRLHERVGSAFADSSLSASGVGAAFPSYYWQLLFGPFFAAMAVFMVVFLWAELRRPRHRALVGAALGLLALAVALDFVDGLGPDHPLNVYAHLATVWDLDPRTRALFGMGGLDAVVHLSRSVEESTEMLAMTLLWVTFLSHFVATVGGDRKSVV